MVLFTKVKKNIDFCINSNPFKDGFNPTVTSTGKMKQSP